MKRSSKSEMSLFKSNEMRGVDKSLILRNKSWTRTFIEENTFRIEKRMNWAQNWMLMQRSSKRRLKSCNKELRKQRNKSLRNSLNLIWSEVQALMTRFVRRRLTSLNECKTNNPHDLNSQALVRVLYLTNTCQKSIQNLHFDQTIWTSQNHKQKQNQN